MEAKHPGSLAKLEAIARTIWEERGDLRERFRSIASLDYWGWLMAHGSGAYPRILEELPVAPTELRSRVSDSNLQGYLWLGVTDAQLLFDGLMAGGFDPGLGGAMLDYGCGSGRILRMAARFAESCELHGADVDAEAIAWCRKNLPFARYEAIAPRPPSRYPDGLFDAVYSFSVFSHLPEALHRAWLEELHRITRPGAALVLTIHGRRTVERFIAGQIHPLLTIPSREQMLQSIPTLNSKGFVYFPIPYPYAALPAADREADVYGITFIYERYIRERWLDLFELVGLREAPTDWQDYVVLRRR